MVDRGIILKRIGQIRKCVSTLETIRRTYTKKQFLSDGMIPEPGDVARLTARLGRPLRSYRDFAADIAASA